MYKYIILCFSILIFSSFKICNPDEHISFDKKTHDFGNITQGVPVSSIFVISNIGEEDVLINNIKTQCGCTSPNYSKTPIAKSGKQNITVGFNAVVAGSFTKKLTVETNFGEVELIIRGNVIAN